MEKNNQRGFMTLFIVIILGIVALALTLALSTSTFLSIHSGTDTKNFDKAKSLTNACAEVALENLRENNSYVGTSNVTLNGDTCSYTVVNTGGSNRTVSVSGTVSDIINKLSITTTAFNPLLVSSWQNVP